MPYLHDVSITARRHLAHLPDPPNLSASSWFFGAFAAPCAADASDAGAGCAFTTRALPAASGRHSLHRRQCPIVLMPSSPVLPRRLHHPSLEPPDSPRDSVHSHDHGQATRNENPSFG